MRASDLGSAHSVRKHDELLCVWPSASVPQTSAAAHKGVWQVACGARAMRLHSGGANTLTGAAFFILACWFCGPAESNYTTLASQSDGRWHTQARVIKTGINVLVSVVMRGSGLRAQRT